MDGQTACKDWLSFESNTLTNVQKEFWSTIKFQQLSSQKTARLSGKANAAPTDETVGSAGHLSIEKTVLQIRILMFLGLLDPDPLVRGTDPVVRGMDPRIRIRTKMSWIRSTGKNNSAQVLSRSAKFSSFSKYYHLSASGFCALWGSHAVAITLADPAQACIYRPYISGPGASVHFVFWQSGALAYAFTSGTGAIAYAIFPAWPPLCSDVDPNTDTHHFVTQIRIRIRIK